MAKGTVRLTDLLAKTLKGSDPEATPRQQVETLARALRMSADELEAQVAASDYETVLNRYMPKLRKIRPETLQKRLGLLASKGVESAEPPPVSNIFGKSSEPPPLDAIEESAGGKPTVAGAKAAATRSAGKKALKPLAEQSFRNFVYGVKEVLPKGFLRDNIGAANPKAFRSTLELVQSKMLNSGDVELAEMSRHIDTYLKPLLAELEENPDSLLAKEAWTPKQWRGLLTGGKDTPDRAIEFWQKQGTYSGGKLPRMAPIENAKLRATWGAAALDSAVSQDPMFVTTTGDPIPVEAYTSAKKTTVKTSPQSDLEDALGTSGAVSTEPTGAPPTPTAGSPGTTTTGPTTAKPKTWFGKGVSWVGEKVKSAVTNPNEFLAGGAENRSYFQAAARGMTRTAAGEAISATKVLSRLATSPFGLLALLAAPMAMRSLTGRDRVQEIEGRTLSPLEFAVAQRSARREQQQQMAAMMQHPILGPKLAQQMANAEQAQALELAGVPGYSTSDTY